MIIRIRAATGTSRIKVEANDAAKVLFEKAAVEMKLHATPFKLAKNPDGSNEIQITEKSVQAAGLKHGDMIHLITEPSETVSRATPTLDDVDRILDTKDGMVVRKRDPQFCKHNDSSKCIHCTSLDPYDPMVLSSMPTPIKFLSFHSYLRQLRQGISTDNQLINLQELRCSVKKSCGQCPGWPKGVCTQCLPSAVRLSRQKFRHVDLLSFEFSDSVNNFIDFWRKSGSQRIGHLYGKYEEYKFENGKHGVPLGIQATVTAIYEPPQHGSANGVELLDDPNEKTIEKVASLLGLSKVGWIFTDLENDPNLSSGGNIKYKRFISDDNSVLSSSEVIYAAMLQCDQPNYVANKYSSAGKFGSKFVTCVVSGDVNNEIALKGYQATNDAMALVRADCLVPSSNKMNEACVKTPENDHYIPEVLYTEKNEYNVEVTKKAQPTIPLEYLFVDLMASFKMATMSGSSGVEPFLVENRAVVDQMQSLGALQKHFSQRGSLLDKMSDLHLLWYLATNDVVPLMVELQAVLEAIKTRNSQVVEEWASRSASWQTLQTLMQFSNEQ